MRVDALRAYELTREPGALRSPVAPAQEGFAAHLSNVIAQLEGKLADGDQAAIAAAEERIDVHQAALALERADLELRLVTKVRNKVVDAYREIMRLTV